MADPYGILPSPKYDVNQPEYLGFINGSMPITADTNKILSRVTEGQALRSHDNLPRGESPW